MFIVTRFESLKGAFNSAFLSTPKEEKRRRSMSNGIRPSEQRMSCSFAQTRNDTEAYIEICCLARIASRCRRVGDRIEPVR